VLPAVATEVLRLMRGDDASATDLSALVHKDPGIAARVLRLANSATYAPRSPITTLPLAIARIGTRALAAAIMAIALEEGVFHVPGFEAELASRWRHSLGAACFAREVARARGRDADTAFLCGLLHRIGEPVLLQAALEEAPALGLPTKGPAARVRLFALAGELAPLVGTSVGARWELPPVVVAAARHHDEPAAAGEHAVDCAVVFVARQLTTSALAPDESTPAVTPEAPAYALLGLADADLAALAARAGAVRQEIDALTGAA
jgi:HD-like signal output (HDOD) protein